MTCTDIGTKYVSEPRLRAPQLCPVVGALPGNVSHPSL